MSVGLMTGLDDELALLIVQGVLVRGVDEAVSDVAGDSSGEEHGFLADEADLATEPGQVVVTDVVAIELDAAGDRVVEPLEQTYDCALARA
jgi:hypothetical protein